MKILFMTALLSVVFLPAAQAEEIYDGVDLTRDVEIETTAGYHLSANLFKPTEEGQYPVLVTMMPYGKDKKKRF